MNSGNEVFIGTTSGTGSQSASFSLPPGNDYDNCTLIVNAYVTDTNGDTCKQTTTRVLDCNPFGGRSKTAIYPNPTRSVFNVESTSNSKITEINVRNIYGNLVVSRTGSNDEINMSGQKVGVYFVEIKLEDGTTEIKKLILER